MTWAEFRIKLHAYKRIELNEWQRTRLIAYQVHLLQYMFSKKKPPKIDDFMPLEPVKKKEVNDYAEMMRERIKQAQEQYLKEKHGES